VAGGFTSFGVLAKIVYDGVIARRTAKRENVQWLADDRRAAYEAFLDAAKRQLAANEALWKLVGEARAGRTEISDEEQAQVPPSAMNELVEGSCSGRTARAQLLRDHGGPSDGSDLRRYGGCREKCSHPTWPQRRDRVVRSATVLG
jgi:hypothetical protein